MFVLALLVSSTFAAPLPCGMPLLGEPPPLAVPPHDPAPPDAALEERDAYGTFPYSTSSDHFIVKWGSGGGVDESDVDFLIAAFEDAWQIEIEEMGHPAPPGTDRYLFNVYIGDSGSGTPDGYGAAGYYSADPDGYPMVVIAADTLSDLAYTEITAAHEFYHAIQNGIGTYSYSGDAAWYWEATAEWASGQVYPDNEYSAVFLLGLAYLPYLPVNFFDYPDRGTLQEYHQYGAFIFPTYLSEQVADWTIIRDSWVEASSRDPLTSLDDLLREQGTSVAEVFPWFAAHNATWDYANGEIYADMLDEYARWYGDDDHRVVVELDAAGTEGWVDAPSATLPQFYGYNVIRLEDPPAGSLVIGFRGDAEGSDGSEARWGAILVEETTREVTYTELALEDGEGEATLSLDGSEQNVYLAVAATPEEARDDETFGWSYKVSWGEEGTETGETEDTGEETGETGEIAGGDSDEPAETGGGTLVPKTGCACSSAPTRSPWAAVIALALSARYLTARRSSSSKADSF